MAGKVLIVAGSPSDLDIMKECTSVLDSMGVEHELVISSAHRTPDDTVKLAKGAQAAGFEVIVAGAGFAAHLALTRCCRRCRCRGIPVAAMGVGASGAKNAGLFAASILALKRPELQEKIRAFRLSAAKVRIAGPAA